MIILVIITQVVISYGLDCGSLNQTECSQNCIWNQYSQVCRYKTCDDLDFRNCTTINDQICIAQGPRCVAQSCDVLNNSMCQQYLKKSFNRQGQCEWSAYYNQCTIYQEGMECRSYLNQEACENNDDRWECVWNSTRQLCNDRNCQSLGRSDCEIFSLALNSLNNNYCLWTDTNQYEGEYCAKFAFVTCELIQTQSICLNPENAAQSTCHWNGTTCTTKDCSDLSLMDCDQYLMPNKTLNGQHCYSASNGCERAPWNITCNQLTTEASCQIVDSIVGVLCSWLGTECVVANCSTLNSSQCPPDDNPAIVNGQYCVMEGSKCILATCESINSLYTGVCNYFKEPGDKLNGHNCIYVKQGCQTLTPKYNISCGEIGLETACYYSIDSNHQACVWNASDRCDILDCDKLKDVNLKLCQEYQYPKRSANGFQCLQEGNMCTPIPLSDYGCKTFNQFPQKCQTYNYQTGPKMVAPCYYSTLLEQCYETNSTKVNCQAFADSQSECELPIIKPYLNASLLCQFTNKSECKQITQKKCSGITNNRTCQIAQMIGSYPCQWSDVSNSCYESSCHNRTKSECSTQQLCFWDDSMVGQEHCVRYSFEVQITNESICSQIGGSINQQFGVCMLRLCSDYQSLNSCVEATGHMNYPLNCYWKQSHVKVDQKQTSYDQNSCEPKLVDDICQLDRRFLCNQLVNTVWDCRKLLPNYGWNSECIKCSNITDQSNCVKTDSACQWVDNKCIGQGVEGPSYQSFHGCTSADWSLGYSPTMKKCFICALLQQIACSVQVGCEWIQNRCQGLRHNSAMMQSRQRCEVVKQFAFSRDDGCLDCSSQDISVCEKQILCVWDGYECIGRRSSDSYLTYSSCNEFGEEYGYDSYDRTCTNCLLGNCSQLPQCYWEPTSQLCLGIRVTNPNITYAQCINMGPEFGFTTLMSQRCVICSELQTITQCEQVSQICQWFREGCLGQRIQNANTFYLCQNYAPDFGFDSKSQMCLQCRNISRQDCNSNPYCQLVNGYCLGKQLSDYKETQCLQMGIKYALDGDKCFDCSIQTDCSNKICRNQMISTNGTMACRRNRQCYTQCSQITEQLDCYDLIFNNIIKTCVWYNSKCVTSQCQYLQDEDQCLNSYTQNTEFKQCYWSQDHCTRFECGYISNQYECDSVDAQVTNIQCIWNQNRAYCSQLLQPIQCQSLTSNYSCARSLDYKDDLRCKWVLNECQPQVCSDITDVFTCLDHSFTLLNNDQMCLWSAGEVCKQYKPEDFSCYQVTTESQCIVFDNCTWIDQNCKPYSCATISGESECTLFSQEQISPNVYCIWKMDPSNNNKFSCQSQNNITCSYFQSQFSCQHGLGIGKCAWKNNTCAQAQCSDFNQHNCPCLYDGQSCVPKPQIFDCSVFVMRSTCLKNAYTDTYQCIWRQNRCQMGNCSLLLNDKECNRFLTQPLNGQYCYWDQNSCLISQQLPYCNMIENSQTCQQLTYKGAKICNWETSECVIKSCSELSITECSYFPSGLPSKEYCDIYEGMCVTIGGFDCHAIYDKGICLQTIFPYGERCEWINSTCQVQSCKNYIYSCDCLNSQLGCEYDYEQNVCKPISCTSITMSAAKCFTAGCNYNYSSNTCMVQLNQESQNQSIPLPVESMNSWPQNDEAWPSQYAIILIIDLYFLL